VSVWATDAADSDLDDDLVRATEVAYADEAAVGLVCATEVADSDLAVLGFVCATGATDADVAVF
jgi:hypothetical protein